MKTKLMFAMLFGLLVAGACATDLTQLIPSSPTEGIQGTPQIRQAQATRTEEPTATPTVGYQATALVALTAQEYSRLTAEAANLAVAQFTADAMSMQLEQERLENEKLIASLNGTQVSINATGTAAQFIPLTSTVQAQNAIIIKAQITERAAEPTLTYAKKKAELYVKYGEQTEQGTYILIISGIVFCVCFSLFVLVRIVLEVKRSAPVAQVRDLNAEERTFTPIPMVTDKVNPNVTHRSEIHCTKEQLFIIADGIINQHMTLAFGQWEGTENGKGEISKSVLNIVRQSLSHHKIINPLTGHDGEWDVKTVECEKFMRYVLENGKPPAPFVCIG